MMNDFNKELIHRLLLQHRLFRIDDVLLYAEYIRQNNSDYLSGEQKQTFCDILEHHFEYNLPNYKSIIRERAAIQERHPELKDERTKQNRERLEEEYRNAYGKN